MNAAELFAFPITCDLVGGFEGLLEVKGVFGADIGDAEVIDYKAESDGSSGVSEESWDVFGLVV